MAEYKLDFTAEEVNQRIKKIQDGGIGYTDGETVHPIDPKYLGGAVLPVVELSTIATTDGVALTAEESTQIDDAFANGTPVAIKGSIDLQGYIIGFSAVFSSMLYEGVVAGATAQLDLYRISVSKQDDAWVFKYSYGT